MAREASQRVEALVFVRGNSYCYILKLSTSLLQRRRFRRRRPRRRRPSVSYENWLFLLLALIFYIARGG